MKKTVAGIILVIVIVGLSLGLYFSLFYSGEDYWSSRPSFIVVDLEVNDFAYQLQNVEPQKIATSKYDLIIIDYSADGTEAGEFSKETVSYMKNTERKILLSYMSIGEAENYRFYWNDSWDADHDGIPDEGAPEWLDIENPEWEGNYKVHYWDPEWQKIIFGTPKSYLDRIISAGFDGVYLDIIDAYEYYEEQGRTTAKAEMIDFVISISEYAKNINPDFLVFPQNGERLLANASYREAIDGIGREDVFYNDNEKNTDEVINETLSYLKLLTKENKPVLVIDYPTNTELIEESYKLAIKNGFLIYVTTRELDSLIIHPQFPPD